MNRGINIVSTLDNDNRPFVLEWTPVYPANSVVFNTQLTTIEGDILRVYDTDANIIYGNYILDAQIEVGEIETTGKPASIDEVINRIEEALND